MDANGLRFWMLAERQQWTLPGDPPAVQYDAERRSLKLANQRSLPTWRSEWAMQVTNPDGSQSPRFFFTVQPSMPSPVQVTRLNPPSPVASPEPQTITVTGRGFQPSLQLTITFPDGRTTTVGDLEPQAIAADETEIRLPFTFSSSGLWSIRVQNPDGSQSDVFHFTVLSEAIAVSITRIDPITPVAQPDPQSLTVIGQGFQAGLTLTLFAPNGDRHTLAATALDTVTETRIGLTFPLGLNLQTQARSRLLRVPQTRDAYQTRAYWDEESHRVVATGAAAGTVGIYLPPPGQTPTDLAMGYDGVLYMAIAGGVVMLDRRGRWQPITVSLAGFTAWRLAADPSGGVWVLDRHEANPSQRQIARLQGMPFPDRPHAAYSPETFRPCPENPLPPRLTLVWSGQLDAEEPVAIACSPQGEVALLSWATEADARIRCWHGAWSAPLRLHGAQFPYSLTWVGDRRIALLLHTLTTEAPVYEIGITGDVTGDRAADPAANLTTVYPVGDYYPLRNATGDPFVQGITLPPHYPTPTDISPLHHLSLPAVASQGHAQGHRAFDSGSSETIWHRLYLEAVIPPKCGIRVYLAATDGEERPAIASDDWYEHQFGEKFAPGDRQIPLGAWVPEPSERPFHPGLLACDPEPNRAGLFTALVQRSRRRVRSLQGRYLWVRVDLSGDGRSSPELAALRVYGSRFSYLQQYLPALYHETTVGDEANQPGASTPADFLERFLDNFEGILTPLEDRIAHAYLLTDPRTTPTEALDWLGSWIGVTFDAGYPAERRRQLLQHTPTLYQKRGTLAGLKLALDLATNGAVSRGEVIVVEDFRLRRTFATILGANLAAKSDPLLQGLSVSGNAFVGDTLILGEESRADFLALFNADQLDEAETEAVQTFFDTLAHRVTVLVHEAQDPQDLGLIRRIVDLEVPAHVLARVVTARYPLMVGIAALVGVDTYLSQKPEPSAVRIAESQLGVRDVIQRPPSLDPRLEAGADPFGFDLRRPTARVQSPVEAEYGQSFRLDGSESQAFVNRSLDRYIWTWLD